MHTPVIKAPTTEIKRLLIIRDRYNVFFDSGLDVRDFEIVSSLAMGSVVVVEVRHPDIGAGVGFAVCSKEDQFYFPVGRSIALARALDMLAVRYALWAQ